MLDRDCHALNFRFRQNYETQKNGFRKIFICRDCDNSFAETYGTPAARLVTDLSKIAEVLRARTEGLGFNACARTFKISRYTLRSWELRFFSLKKTLFLYSLCHNFLSQIIEGDELYTKIHQNTKAYESKGWSILIMERVTRFIWLYRAPKVHRLHFKKNLQRGLKTFIARGVNEISYHNQRAQSTFSSGKGKVSS